jgi:hypothetical protein
VRRFAWRWGPALAWAAAVFALSAQHRLPQLPGLLGWDKLQHSTAFVVGGLLLEGRRHAALLAAVLGLGYAVTDELHQLFVPGRNADPRDWMADAVGIMAGIALWRLYVLLTQRRARRRAPARAGDAAVSPA